MIWKCMLFFLKKWQGSGLRFFANCRGWTPLKGFCQFLQDSWPKNVRNFYSQKKFFLQKSWKHDFTHFWKKSWKKLRFFFIKKKPQLAEIDRTPLMGANTTMIRLSSTIHHSVLAIYCSEVRRMPFKYCSAGLARLNQTARRGVAAEGTTPIVLETVFVLWQCSLRTNTISQNVGYGW